MQELVLTPSTIVVVALVIIGCVMAVRRMLSRGLCDCGDKCDGCSGCSKECACECDGSHECPSAKRMASSLERHA